MDRDVEKYLPHRKPFLFVDEFDVTDDASVISGSRTFSEEDFFFKGHFPGYPVVPGVILVEAMAQCGGAGMVKRAQVPDNCDFFLASIKDVKFKRKVLQGDKFDMEVTTLRTMKNRFLIQHGRGSVNGEEVIEAEWICAMVPREESKG